jgi:hypothetical protein
MNCVAKYPFTSRDFSNYTTLLGCLVVIERGSKEQDNKHNISIYPFWFFCYQFYKIGVENLGNLAFHFSEYSDRERDYCPFHSL